MLKFNAKLGTAVAVATLLTTVLAPASLAATNVTVSNNGAGSHSHVGVNNSSTTTIGQSNGTFVVNNVNVSNNTGGNKTNKNTGGSVTTTSGSVNTTVTVSNGGSANVATAPTGTVDTNTTVNVDHNGADTHNKVHVYNSSLLSVLQQNWTSFINNVTGASNTGSNNANKNTGGPVTSTSGDVTTNVTVNNTGSGNAQM
jgi:hypothetical protein